MTNYIYLATSIDGYIADRDGDINWLQMVPNPEQSDYGWNDFMAGIDAMIMGRNTFQTVLGFDVPWPYTVPVFVLSTTLTELPESHRDKATLVNGPLPALMEQIHQKGFQNLYIDGGVTVQRFLQANLVDVMILTRIPTLRGGGVPLFGELAQPMNFDHENTQIFSNQIVQSRYRRKRD